MPTHQVVLLDSDQTSFVGPGLPSLESDWPSPGEVRALVGAPHARAIRSPDSGVGGVITHVLWDAEGEASGPWTPLADLDAAPLGALVADAVTAYRDDIDDDRQQWYRRGWLEQVEAWTDAELAPRGCARRGASEVVKLWGLSALLRIPVRDGAGREASVWFKAACDGFRAEPALTEAVAALAPGLVPRVIAVDADRAWMLMEEFTALSERASADLCAAAATEIALLQLRSVAHTDALVAAGAPDRGTRTTQHDLAEQLDAGLELSLIAPPRLAAARAALPRLVAQSARLHALGLPATLVHGDLHSGNVAGTPTAPVVFDWTDTCVGHPYVDGVHLVQSVTAEADAAAAILVRDAYLAPWREAYPDVDHDDAWALAEVEERMFTAISYERIARAEPQASRWELAGIAARLIGELADLAERGVGGAP